MEARKRTTEARTAAGDDSKNKSYGFAKNAGVEDGEDRVVADWRLRGQLEVPGAAYYSAEDIEKYMDTTFVGLSYQISSISLIDSVSESFRVVLDLNMMYKIDEGDREAYENWKKKGSVSFQEINDATEEGWKVKVKPVVYEIRNAVETPEESQGRIINIQQCYDHRFKKWEWYVSLYLQIRCQCYEEFEMGRFPFARNSLQVFIQCCQSMSQVMLVPFNSRSALPHFFYNAKDDKVQECFKRGNCLKTDKNSGNWLMEQHHAFFVPNHLLPPMPSGNKFSTCIICVQCKQSASFFIYNTVIVVLCLPLLSTLCMVVDVLDVADRMSIVLTLLLTMSTYKIVIADWIPQKDYLTIMDWYILVGFVLILFIALWVMLSAAVFQIPYLEGLQDLIAAVEVPFMISIWVLWILGHVIMIGPEYWSKESWYKDWTDLLGDENDRLQDIANEVQAERDKVKKVQLICCPKPHLPKRKTAAEGTQ